MRLNSAAKLVRRFAIATSVLATACLGGQSQPVLIHLQVQDIVVDSGAGQTGVEGQPLATPITAHALMSDGSRDTSHTIYCRIESGGGSIQVGDSTASGDGAVLPGPGDGTISVMWTMGTAGVAQQLHLYIITSQTITADVTAVSQPAP